jgi:hypothetical protein
MSQVEISGIVKVPHSDISLSPATIQEAEARTCELKLTPLPEDRHHTTVLHQSVRGLKGLSKEVKKFQKGKTDSNPVVYPEVELPQINTDGAEVLLVEDTHPSSGAQRKTLRIVLRGQLQEALGAWVAEFCELNSLERDERELQRVYHISYSNLTGLPGDSVR